MLMKLTNGCNDDRNFMSPLKIIHPWQSPLAIRGRYIIEKDVVDKLGRSKCQKPPNLH